jgi:hypothetical protein
VGEKPIIHLGNLVLVILFWPYFLHMYPSSKYGVYVTISLWNSNARTHTNLINVLPNKQLVGSDSSP